MTIDLDALEALIAGARKLPRQFQDAQLPDSAYDEDSALAELDAVGYMAVVTSNKLADALESTLAELRQARERADEAANHAELALAGRRNAIDALAREQDLTRRMELQCQDVEAELRSAEKIGRRILADATAQAEALRAELRQERERADEAANHAELALAGRRTAQGEPLPDHFAPKPMPQGWVQGEPADAQVEAGAREAFFTDDAGGHIRGGWTWDTIPEQGRENYRTMVRGVLHAALRAAAATPGENREEQERG